MGAAARVASRRVRDPESWLRKVCLALPGTSEAASWGHPNFRAAGRTFAVFEIYRGRPCIATAAEPEEQTFLVERFGFFKTPYVGNRGWVSVYVDEPASFSLVRDLVLAAHRRAMEKASRGRGAGRSAQKRSRHPSGGRRRRRPI
jgi:predicted DNA-binding protein (MmcQ/YjbR family)